MSMEEVWTRERTEVNLKRVDRFRSTRWKVSFRAVLTVVGCLSVMVVGLLVFGISYAAGTSGMSELETELKVSILDRIMVSLQSFVASAFAGIHTLSEILRHDAAGGFNLTEANSDSIRKIIFPIARQFAPTMYIGFNPSGFFVGYTRVSNRTQYDLVISKLGQNLRNAFRSTELGDPIFSTVEVVYNATVRPWFQMALATKNPAITDVYPFAGTTSVPSLGITVSIPLFEDLQPPPFFPVGAPSNLIRPFGPVPSVRKIKLVVGADLSLSFVSEFLSGLMIGKAGEAFVVDRVGVFIGTSQPQRLGTNSSERLTHTTEINDVLVNVTMERLLALSGVNRDNFSDYIRLVNVTNTIISANGKNFRVAASRFVTLQWFVVVVVPESDYLAAPTWNFYVALIIGMSITVVVAIGFALFATAVTRSLRRMQKSMEIITKELCFEDETESFSHLTEVDSMEQSFLRLKSGLISFSRYVPLCVVRLLMHSSASAELGVTATEATSFFSDIAGFTSIAESITPEVLMNVLGTYLSQMSAIILNSQGVVGDYIGDAVFAFWNCPTPNPRHPFLACKAALDQQKKLKELRESWKDRFLPTLNVRMGLTVGNVLAGNIGSQLRLKYTLLGDPVNLASRLENLNKFYGTSILVNEELARRVKKEFVFRMVDVVRVAGKDKPVRVFELLCERDSAASGDLDMEQMSDLAFEAYANQRWTEAKSMYAKMGNDSLSRVMIQRIDEFETNPPPHDWDGATSFENK